MMDLATRPTLALALLSLLSAAGCDQPGAKSGAPITPAGTCGPAREAVSAVSAPIVAGSGSWTPSVVALTAAQGLAVGGIYTRDGFGGFELSCTGTLIAPNVVLTAAHCIVINSNSQYSAAQVRFGVGKDLATPRAMFNVSEVHVHTGYDYWGSDAAHDITVLVLASSATETLGAEIDPIPLNCAALSSSGFVGADIQMVGYGATDKQGQVFGTAQAWAIETVTSLTSVDLTVDGHGVSGVCYGDSGGPALFTLSDGRPHIVGVLSWGDAICTHTDHFVRADKECNFITPFMPAAPSCGALTEAGTCDGDAVVSCSQGAVSRVLCGASGQVCQVTGGVAACVAPPSQCGAETLAGRCDGVTAVFCANNAVVRDGCGDRGLICGADPSGAARCVEPPVVTPSCGSETQAGRCDGATVVTCDPATGVVSRDPCGARGQVCASDGGGAHCQAPTTPVDPCGGETFFGRCDGSDAIYCVDGAVKVRHCDACGLSCGVASAVGGVDCVP